MVLDSIAGQDKKTAPPATPFANAQLQDEELLSVEGNNLGDRLPGNLLLMHRSLCTLFADQCSVKQSASHKWKQRGDVWHLQYCIFRK